VKFEANEYCDETMHADVNAARNHAARSSKESMHIYLTKQLVLGIVMQRFLRKLVILSNHADKDAERLSKRYDSLAKGLLPGQSLFRGIPCTAQRGFILPSSIFYYENSDYHDEAD
jgi:hypothetical protein